MTMVVVFPTAHPTLRSPRKESSYYTTFRHLTCHFSDTHRLESTITSSPPNLCGSRTSPTGLTFASAGSGVLHDTASAISSAPAMGTQLGHFGRAVMRIERKAARETASD
ncbi:uncharacterized protein J3R85_009083 [Psidium guajava]|nr:uncharacterized protein J3R85_009083 [Psidium guajava]